MTRNYDLSVDYGKPYSEKVAGKRRLKKKLRKLREFYEKETKMGNDFPYFDVNVRRTN